MLHFGNSLERTIGNLGSFSDFALVIRVELLEPPKISSPPTLMVIACFMQVL